MKIEDVIEALNMSIRNKREAESINSKSFLVLHKSIIPDESFKAYKSFEYNLWVIGDKKKWPVLQYIKKYRVISQTELEEYTNILDIEFCAKLFEFVNDDLFLNIIIGNYETT